MRNLLFLMASLIILLGELKRLKVFFINDKSCNLVWMPYLKFKSWMDIPIVLYAKTKCLYHTHIAKECKKWRPNKALPDKEWLIRFSWLVVHESLFPFSFCLLIVCSTMGWNQFWSTYIVFLYSCTNNGQS